MGIRRQFVIKLLPQIPPHSDVSLHYLVKCQTTHSSRNLVNRAISHWRRCLGCDVQQQGGHVKHLMQNCET